MSDDRERKAAIAEHNRLWSFEGAIERLEAICRKDWNAYIEQAPTGRGPDTGSRAWYAHTIIPLIQGARFHIEHGQAAEAAAYALRIGAYASEAQAKFYDYRAWFDHLDRQRARSIAGNETKKDNAEGRRREVLMLALAEIKRAEKVGERLSLTKLAARLAPKIVRPNPKDKDDETLRWGNGTIREDLAKLKEEGKLKLS